MTSFSAHMKKAQELAGRKDYGPALEQVLAAEALLRGSRGSDTLYERAYVYDFKRFNLWELGRREEACAVCREAIADLGSHADWPYLGEYKPVRHTLRASYKMLAFQAAESARTAEEIAQAVELIDRCFEIWSPIDDAPFDPHFETRALIYRQATALAGEEYRSGYFRALRDLADSGVAIDSSDLTADLASPEYRAWDAANPREEDDDDEGDGDEGDGDEGDGDEGDGDEDDGDEGDDRAR